MRQASLLLAGNDTARARAQYEAAARRWFEATIGVVRRLRPACLVGWYGYPQNCLPHVATPQWTAYCRAHPEMCWFDRGGAGNGTGYGGPGGNAKRRLNDKLGWLFAALDVITPSIYLGETQKASFLTPYMAYHFLTLPAQLLCVGISMPRVGETAAQTSGKATTQYVQDTVREAVRLAAATKRHTKVMPCAWLNYDNYWDQHVNHTAPRALLSPEHAEIELGAVRTGAGGDNEIAKM
jgi:hypothetical protein